MPVVTRWILIPGSSTMISSATRGPLSRSRRVRLGFGHSEGLGGRGGGDLSRSWVRVLRIGGVRFVWPRVVLLVDERKVPSLWATASGGRWYSG